MSIDELSTSAFAAPYEGRDEDRLPPQDVGAERSVLGGMLLSKDAIADVVESLKGVDFYRPAHEVIYDAILALYGRGEPADAITVADELTKRGDLSRVGGQAYLHELIQSVPTAANAGFYAEIVAERAVLRRLVEAGTRIVQLGYARTGGIVEDIVNAAQAEVYAVSERRAGEDYQRVGEIVELTLDEIEVAAGRGGEMTGVPTGFTELDQLTNGLHPGQMIVLAARPAVGKSTLGLDIARTAAVRHGMCSVIFSLEMSKTEITMRMLSAEAGIQLQHMRKGTMRDEDWQRISSCMGRVSEAPLFIDDSPNMSLMEIRAKCRRLKQKHNLKLVVIDYLQLMTSGRKVESRQQEVSEFSRALKLLAKELEVPVIAISQLNRGPEQRTDKKPQMSDLRESGCLVASTRVLRADTGASVTLGELYAAGAREVPVWSLDESLRYVPRPMTHVFATGVRPVFELTLASGRRVRGTENHPFLAYQGWTALGDLRTGDRIAVPRHVPAPERFEEVDDDEWIVALARVLAGGASGCDGLDPVVVDEALGLVLAEGARVPERVSYAAKREIALFLREFWAGARVSFGENGAGAGAGAVSVGRIEVSVRGRELAQDVAGLLLRFGISVSLVDRRRGVDLVIDDVDCLRRFLQEITVVDVTGEMLLEAVRSLTSARADGVAAHDSAWESVCSVMSGAGASAAAAGASRGAQSGEQPAADRLGGLATALADLDLDLHAVNDVLWDTVELVTPVGVEPVFDATVLGGHNFIADGIAVHNSIEQDADMVILLHREEMYEKESPRAGEADLIVAKHRNGPTDTITVAFQGHYSRFMNMAPSF